MKVASRQLLLGHLTLTLPSLVMIVGLPAVCWYLLPSDWVWAKLSLTVLSVIIGSILAWIYWAVVVPHWRVRAFAAIGEDDWLAFHRTAARHRIVWPQGHAFEATERRVGSIELQTLAIEQRLYELRQVESVNDEFTTPASMTYYASPGGGVAILVIVGFCLLLGPLVLVEEDFRSIPGWFAIAVGGYFLWRHFRFLRGLITGRAGLMIDDSGLHHYFYPVLNVKWPEVRAIRLTNDDSQLKVSTFSDASDDWHEIDLECIKTGDRNRFARTLLVFLNRHAPDLA